MAIIIINIILMVIILRGSRNKQGIFFALHPCLHSTCKIAYNYDIF